jgi:hypothetical protein
MVDGLKRQSALQLLRAGAIITDESGDAGKENSAPVAQAKPAFNSGLGNSAGTAASNGPGTGTAASNGPGTGARTGADPATVFGARTPNGTGASSGPATGPGTNGKPIWGKHPKSGERVEIDWSQPDASEFAPFGLTDAGKPRQKRRRQRRAQAGSAGAAKANQNITVIADAIKFAHNIVASVTNHSHWATSDDEAQRMADALTDLQSAYGIDISPEQAAWIKAATVIAIPTGFRCMASMQKVRADNAKNVTPKTAPTAGTAKPQAAPVKPNPAPETGGKSGPLTPSQMTLATGGTFDATRG